MTFLFSLTVTKIYGRKALFNALVGSMWLVFVQLRKIKINRDRHTRFFFFRALVHQNIRFGADPRIAFHPFSYIYMIID